MKFFTVTFLVFFIFCIPFLPAAHAAGQSVDLAADKKESGVVAKKESAKKQPQEQEKEQANIYKCAYYTVHLPPDWRAVLPPEEREGLVNAIFARNTNATVITMIIGPRGGADAKLIASMFAEQFKAPQAPIEKNGQYIFSFVQKDALEQKMFNSTSCVSVNGDEFMITTWSGNQKEAQDFLKNNVHSERYAQLLPK